MDATNVGILDSGSALTDPGAVVEGSHKWDGDGA